MTAHFPILTVVLPLIASPICLLLRYDRAAWVVSLAVSWISLGMSLWLLGQVLDGDQISYLLGNWAAPWGIEYRVDILSAFVMVIVSGIGSVIMLYAPNSIANEVMRDRTYLFYTMYLLTLAGLLGIAITGDAFNLFVFLEISSLSTYVMVSLGTDRRALTAAFRYLILGTIGATFYVIGIGMMYQMTGTLNIADLAERLPAVAQTRTILVAIGFVTVGIGLKLGIFPLHVWLPNAYTYAPSVVSAFLAATATKVAIYILVRIYFTLFDANVFAQLPVDEVLLALAVVAILTMSTVAIFQSNAKRLLAYSSVAQIGYMVLGISFVTVTGLMAGLLHLFNHALMKAALFLVLGAVFLQIRSVRLDDMAGIAKQMPFTMAAFVVGGLSLIGLPLTVGFVSKWYLIQAALEKNWWIVALLILVASLLAVIYVWKVVETAYFRPRPDGAVEAKEAPLYMLVPIWLLALGNVYFGIATTQTVGTARAAAKFLLGN